MGVGDLASLPLWSLYFCMGGNANEYINLKQYMQSLTNIIINNIN